MIELLKSYGELFVRLMQSRLPSVTGKTKASISYHAEPNRLRGFGRGFINALETGRGPRNSNTYSAFDKGLNEWLGAKGFPTKKTKSGTIYYQIGTQWFSAKSLAWKINAKGDKTHRAGGKEIYSDALDKFVDELSEAVEKAKHKEYTDIMMAQLKTLSHGTVGS